MAQEEQGQSEAPTRFKLDRARRKGQVARGADLGFATGLAAFLAFAFLAGESAVTTLAWSMRDALVTSGNLADDPGAVFSVTAMVAGRLQRPLMMLAGLIFVVVLLFELLQTGFVFSSQPLKPDFNRMNPAQGLKRLFSVRLLIETGKNVAKLCIYTLAAVLVLRAAVNHDFAAATDARQVAQALARTGMRMVIVFAGLALIFAIIDQLIARRGFFKRMRMSRREIKQESRDREGEPRLKQKRKQLHGEFVKNARSMRGLRGADMLIVNPQHLAIALRYEPAGMTAPTIVSMGMDQMALRLRRLALAYGVEVIENRPLARALMAGGTLGREIPSGSYRAVADLYNGMRRRRRESGN